MRLQDESVTAYALLRKLWHQYDAGGHSMRSQKSRLLESVLFQIHEDLSSIPIDLELLTRIRKEVRRERRMRGPHQLSFAFGITHLSREEFAGVVLIALNQLIKKESARSLHEALLIASAALLLGVDENYGRYKAFVKELAVEELIAEGRQRTDRISAENWQD